MRSAPEIFSSACERNEGGILHCLLWEIEFFVEERCIKLKETCFGEDDGGRNNF